MWFLISAMNFTTLALFLPQSKHCVGNAHLLVTEMELSGKKLINIFSPHDRMFPLVEAVIRSLTSSLIDHDGALRVTRTAARKSADLPVSAQYRSV
jgi:hypothetical protein